MPSAANAKSEKPASSEATDNSPIRQIVTILDHKIRNLEKRKSKLTSYRDLQKAGKELNSDQKFAVAKYDEVAQTLEFARDLAKQVTGIVISAERDAKKQAKREAWVRYAAETDKIREVLLVLDCLMQMGNSEARDDFLNGTNGAAKLNEEDLKILDDLYPEVTPKHELTDEGQPAFHIQSIKAAEHLYAIIDGKPKEVLGTTYTHIKEIVSAVHGCAYFDRILEAVTTEVEENLVIVPGEVPQELVEEEPVEVEQAAYAAAALPVPPAAAVVPAPAYPLRPLPPMTLQEVEHAYFSQYPQQRPITEVIGSQNFFFLQESEIDSPVGTPQPPQIPNQAMAGPIPSQTFTNQHFVRVPDGAVPLPPHFAHPEHAGYPAGAVPLMTMPAPPPLGVAPVPVAAPVPLVVNVPSPANAPTPIPAHTHSEERSPPPPGEDNNDDEWQENRSPGNEDGSDRKTQGQGDGQNRFRRYGRGGSGSRGAANGHRGRGYPARHSDGYRGRHNDGYQPRSNNDGYQPRSNKDGYQGRQYDGYQHRHKEYRSGADDSYYGNGDAGDHREHREPREHREHREPRDAENGGRERYTDGAPYGAGGAGGYKTRGRGAPRGARSTNRPPRAHTHANPHHYHRKAENVE